MKLATSVNDPEITTILMGGGIGVLRTDTLYGLVALASNEQAVNRVYRLKDRDSSKSPIVLIHDVSQLYDVPDNRTIDYLKSVWPGKVSAILPSVAAPVWIRRDNASVAYRMPDDGKLRQLLASVGPLIAPSANPEGLMPAMDIEEAKNYFADSVDFYVDDGRVSDSAPSQIIRVGDDGTIERLR